MTVWQIATVCILAVALAIAGAMTAFYIHRAHPPRPLAPGEETVCAFCKPDGRGWVGIACYCLVLVVFAMIYFDRSLLKDEYFKVLGTAIVLTGWANGVVSWAYSATKTGGDLANRNADLVQKQAEKPPLGNPDVPQQVEVTNKPDNPVPTTDSGETAAPPVP